MALLKDLVVFRDDLYFEGAVQADWFYLPRQAEIVAKSFVFHGPKNHAVAQQDFRNGGLMDTASFALHLAQKMEGQAEENGLTLAIAGYGTGKSHLAVALSSLLSGSRYMPELHEAILGNVARADADIASKLRPLVQKPRLILTINGMRDFNLHYELLRVAEKALKLYGADLSVLARLNKVKETASAFIERSFSRIEDRFAYAAKARGITESGEQLKDRLLEALDDENSPAFDAINEVYTEFNGHPIRLDEGVSASQVLETLLQECCGLHGQFDGIVIFFDEFGRFLEYVSANPAAAGDSALQQIFESVQNAEGTLQFVGFIQSDIKSYLQRVDKSSNISRYIDRYDAGEKIYLSSNLETIFANLLEKVDREAFEQLIGTRLSESIAENRQLFDQLQKWLPLRGIWSIWEDYKRIILEEIYPLHPISTYLLCSLTDWLQSRSSLTLLSEKIRRMGNTEITPTNPLPLIYPVELLKGAFFEELLNAEEQGRQRSQFCILLSSIYRKFDTKLTEDAQVVLLANLILRICRFRFEQRNDLIYAIGECAGLDESRVNAALQLLEDEYAVLSYDDRLICFDFVADSVGANEFRNFLKVAANRRPFDPEMLQQNDIQECAELLRPIETDFGSKHGIQTREWFFVQRIEHIDHLSEKAVTTAYRELKSHTLPNTERGLLLWLYIPKEASSDKLDRLMEELKETEAKQAFVVIALDDIDNGLQDAIVAYRVLADMPEEQKIRYQRFYADALERARERVSLLFAELKQQRKVITAEGIQPASKRLKIYLTSVFETVYPYAVPFDFEGFDAKGASGNAYKHFCTIMKWILMDDMSYVKLKSQSSDVKNRVESILGPVGQYSWRALSGDYSRAVKPANESVGRIFSALESLLDKKKTVPFHRVSEQLTAPPYGMNEYAAFMALALFSQLFAFTSRLELNGERYSTSAWAEEVLQDKKFDVKLFNKTRLLLVDAGETISRFRAIFHRIKTNNDFSKVDELREALELLKQEEDLPKELEAEDENADMLLSMGASAYRSFTEQMQQIGETLDTANQRLDPYMALSAAQEVQQLYYQTYANGRYVYSMEQKTEMESHISTARRIATSSFADGWIKRHNCSNPDKFGGYRAHTLKAIDLFEKFGFSREAIDLTEKLSKEEARIKLIKEQEALINACESYLMSSTIRPGMTQANLSALQEQGTELSTRFDSFDYTADQRFVDTRQRIISRVNELSTALEVFREQLEAIWNAVYDISSIEDVRHVIGRIEAILSSGLTDRDREDLEAIDHELSTFDSEMQVLLKAEYSRADLDEACEKAKERYQEFEIDMTQVIDEIHDRKQKELDELEEHWISQYLTVDPETMSQPELDKWKRDTQPLPIFVSASTEARYHVLMSQVEECLTKRRIQYIVMLYQQLTPEEQKRLLDVLQHSWRT